MGFFSFVFCFPCALEQQPLRRVASFLFSCVVVLFVLEVCLFVLVFFRKVSVAKLMSMFERLDVVVGRQI